MWMSYKFTYLLLTILGATLVVGLQLISLPILSILFGDVGHRESFILLFLYLGMTLGMVPVKSNFSFGILVSIVVGMGLTILGLGFDSIVGFSLNQQIIQKSILLFFCLTLGWTGHLVQKITYQIETFDKQYQAFNIFSFFILAVWTSLFPILGFNNSCFILALSALLLLVFDTRIKAIIAQDFHRGITISWEDLASMPAWQSILAGIFSGLFVSIYFDLLNIFMYPIRIRYSLYLLLVFTFLGSSIKIRQSLSELKINTVSKCCLSAFVWLLVVLIVVFGGKGSYFFLDPRKISELLPLALNHYFFLIIPFAILLFTPYVFLAVTVPIQDKVFPDVNHLFYCTLGSTLGLFAFIVFMGKLELIHQLVVLGVCVFTLALLGRRLWQVAVILFLIVFLYQTTDFNLLQNLDLRAISQGMRIFDSNSNRGSWDGSKSKTSNLIQNFEFLVRDNHQVGFISKNPISNWKRLGLGGYHVALFKPHDLIRSLVAEEMVTEHTKRILVMGLGNHITLSRLDSFFSYNGRRDIEVDVVDNFPLFDRIDFLNAVAREGGFHWPRMGFRSINDDVLNFLANTPASTYDLIVWNLTWPNYGTTGKIFTEQMSRLVARSLTPDGVYISDQLGNRLIDCSLRSGFPYTVSYPLDSCWPFAFQASKLNVFDNFIFDGILSRVSSDEARSECQSVKLLRLSNTQTMPSFRKFGVIRNRECNPKLPSSFDDVLKLKTSTRLSLAIMGKIVPIVFSVSDLGNKFSLGSRLKNSTELFFEKTKLKHIAPIFLSSTDSEYFKWAQIFSVFWKVRKGVFYLPSLELWSTSFDRFRMMSSFPDKNFYSLESPREEAANVLVRRYLNRPNDFQYDFVPIRTRQENTCKFVNQYRSKYQLDPDVTELINYNALLNEIQPFLSLEERRRTMDMALVIDELTKTRCQQI